ncbi:MAG: hypothetical protein ACE5EX_00060 [Phycisphaerae bacterium]
MRTRTRTSRSARWTALLIAAVGSAGCGGVPVFLSAGSPYDGGYYYDDFFYIHDPYTYYDGSWHYDDYWYNDSGYAFVDYIDGWYYDGYYDCYYCKTIDDVDSQSLEEPAAWDGRWGPWTEFVRARVEFLLTKRARDRFNVQAPSGE